MRLGFRPKESKVIVNIKYLSSDDEFIWILYNICIA